MAAVSVRDLDETVRERLRIRAARHGRSMEAEIRVILTEAVSPPRPQGPGSDAPGPIRRPRRSRSQTTLPRRGTPGS